MRDRTEAPYPPLTNYCYSSNLRNLRQVIGRFPFDHPDRHILIVTLHSQTDRYLWVRLSVKSWKEELNRLNYSILFLTINFKGRRSSTGFSLGADGTRRHALNRKETFLHAWQIQSGFKPTEAGPRQFTGAPP